MRALISVYDKANLVPFAQRLASAGVELISTGGTAQALRTAGLAVIDFDVDRWSDVASGAGRLEAFVRPKDLG